MTRYEKGFFEKCAECGIDRDGAIALMRKQAIGFETARGAAKRVVDGRWTKDTIRKLLERAVRVGNAREIGSLGHLGQSRVDKVLSQVDLSPGLRQYLSGTGSVNLKYLKPEVIRKSERTNEIISLLSDLLEKPRLHAKAVADSGSPEEAMKRVKSIVPAKWKGGDNDSMSLRLFDALAKG